MRIFKNFINKKNKIHSLLDIITFEVINFDKWLSLVNG